MQFYYDGLTQVSEKASSVTNQYLISLGIDEPWQRNSNEFYLADALGSVVAITDVAGIITNRYNYEPFGNAIAQLGSSSNPYQFTAREKEETGLYYYRARYYSPTLHRFLSEDALGLSSGDGNFYGYVRNNPTKFVDPTGLKSKPGWLDRLVDWGATYWGQSATLIDIGADLASRTHSRFCGTGPGRNAERLPGIEAQIANLSPLEQACVNHDISLIGRDFSDLASWKIHLQLAADAAKAGYNDFANVFNIMGGAQGLWVTGKYYLIEWGLVDHPLNLDYLTDYMGVRRGDANLSASR